MRRSLVRRAFAKVCHKFDEFTCSVIPPTDTVTISRFLCENRRHVDPICRAYELSETEAKLYYDSLICDVLNQKLSFGMYSESHGLVAILVNRILGTEFQNIAPENTGKVPECLKIATTGTNDLVKRLAAYEPNIERWLCLNLAAVDPEYGRLDIMSRLVRSSIEKAIRLNFGGAATLTVAAKARGLERFGFREIDQISLKEYATLETDLNVLHKMDKMKKLKLMAITF